MGRRRKAHNLRSVCGRIILKWGLKYKIGGAWVEWINLAQDIEQYPAVVSTVTELQVPLNAMDILTKCAARCQCISAARRKSLPGMR
jgi:hypothetical protein